MLNAVIITLVSIVFTLAAFGQEERKFYQNQIRLSPLRMIDVVNPGIELSYQRFHSRRFSSEFTSAYMTNVVKSGKQFQGYRIGIEEKLLVAGDKRVGVYLSAELVYNHSALKNVDNWGFDTTTQNYINVPFEIIKTTNALNIKGGTQLLIGRFVIDNSWGLGIKYRIVKHFGRKYPFPEQKGFNPFYLSRVEGRSWLINIPLTFKIGYAF